MQATLASAQEAVTQGAEAAFKQLNQHLQPLLHTHDVQEGVLAMLERRSANFKGE